MFIACTPVHTHVQQSSKSLLFTVILSSVIDYSSFSALSLWCHTIQYIVHVHMYLVYSFDSKRHQFGAYNNICTCPQGATTTSQEGLHSLLLYDYIYVTLLLFPREREGLGMLLCKEWHDH